MPRVIVTDPIPPPLDLQPQDSLLVAPRSYIGRGLSAQTLMSCAKDVLRRNGFGIATPLRASQGLRLAVEEEGYSEDANSVAAHHREIIASMLRSGLDLKRLSDVGSPRARLAARIATRYTEALAAERLVDSDNALWAAIEFGLIKKRKVVVYGYFRGRQIDARPEEFEFIDRLAGDDSVFYLPCGDEPIFHANRQWVELLTGRGWELHAGTLAMHASRFHALAAKFASGAVDASGETPDSVDAFEYPDLEQEVRGTLARAKAAALEGISLGEIAIACRDIDLYAPSIASVAREYDLPVDIDCDVPLRETSVGEFVSLIFETVELRSDRDAAMRLNNGRRGFQYEPTLRLLLHRLGPGLSDDKRTEAYRSRPSSLAGWAGLCDAVADLDTVGERPAAQWVSWLAVLLQKWQIRSADKIGGSASDVIAFESLFAALDEHAGDRGGQPVALAVFAADVRDVLANVKTPLLPTRGGLKVLSPNALVGTSFQRLFVIGMAEGILPAPAVESNVVDFCERETLRAHGIHFENALEVPRWEALTFYFTLLAATGKITFSFPRFAADSERIPSSYFRRMAIVPERADATFVSSREEYRRAFLAVENSGIADDAITAAAHQLAVEARRESDAPPDKYDGVIGVPVVRRTWSASSLARIGSCPFKWFASDVLGLSTPDEADTDLRADIRGTLLHKTLEIAVSRVLDASDLRAAMSELLDEAFAEAEAMHQPLLLVANWRLRRSEEIQKLRRAIAADEFLDPGAVVIATECEFNAEFCGLTLKGTIDRIDRLADGRLLAVDYKHSGYVAKLKDENGILGLEIQLPIYAGPALRKLFPDVVCAGGIFVHIADPKRTRSKEVDLERVITRIKEMLAAGRFAVDPDVKRDACTYCAFDVVCRVGPRLALKGVSIDK